MNDEARKSIETACSTLREVQEYLTDAVNNIENNSARTRIQNSLNEVQNCLKECQSIASGLSQQ